MYPSGDAFTSLTYSQISQKHYGWWPTHLTHKIGKNSYSHLVMKIIQRLIIDRFVTCRHGTTNIPKISYDGIIGTNQRRPRSLEFLSKVLNVDYQLSISEGRCFVLFCCVAMRFTKLGCFKLCSWCLWKALNKEGCMGLIP
jgi:hypothetical protein